MSDYTIRFATQQDIDAIIDLCEEHAKFEGCDYDRNGKQKKLSSYLFATPPVIKCLILEINTTIKGYATYMQEFSTWDAAYYIHMDCLYLKPDTRGKGYGKKIIALINAEARSAGFVNVQWQTPADNFNAIAFYKKMGATPKPKTRFYLTH